MTERYTRHYTDSDGKSYWECQVCGATQRTWRGAVHHMSSKHPLKKVRWSVPEVEKTKIDDYTGEVIA